MGKVEQTSFARIGSAMEISDRCNSASEFTGSERMTPFAWHCWIYVLVHGINRTLYITSSTVWLEAWICDKVVITAFPWISVQFNAMLMTGITSPVYPMDYLDFQNIHLLQKSACPMFSLMCEYCFLYGESTSRAVDSPSRKNIKSSRMDGKNNKCR